MNILLDRLPTEYNGYKINTDFRVGIQLCNIFDDGYKEEDDKIDDAIDLLFGAGVPVLVDDNGDMDIDYETIYRCINWFMNGGTEPEPSKQQAPQGLSKDIPYDFDVDADYIFAAFVQQYRVDLTKIRMHWFKFLALFKGLKDTTFNRLQEIRTQDPLDFPAGKPRAAALRQKEEFKINKVSEKRRRELQAVFGDEWEQHI